MFKNLDGLERGVDDPGGGRQQDARVPFCGGGGICRGSFGEGADLELTPTAKGIDHAAVHLKLDVAKRRGEVGADLGETGLPIRHGLGFGLAVDTQSFGGNLDAEVFVEMVLADAKGCLTDLAASQAEQTSAQIAIAAEGIVDGIAIELAVAASEKASLKGDDADTGQGVFGVGAFVDAWMSA